MRPDPSSDQRSVYMAQCSPEGFRLHVVRIRVPTFNAPIPPAAVESKWVPRHPGEDLYEYERAHSRRIPGVVWWGADPVYMDFRKHHGKVERGTTQYLLVSLLVPVVLSAVLPALWLTRRIRSRRTRRLGLCPGCGYDLRATPGQCPESPAAVSTPA